MSTWVIWLSTWMDRAVVVLWATVPYLTMIAATVIAIPDLNSRFARDAAR